jgi:hypothetical protein
MSKRDFIVKGFNYKKSKKYINVFAGLPILRPGFAGRSYSRFLMHKHATDHKSAAFGICKPVLDQGSCNVLALPNRPCRCANHFAVHHLKQSRVFFHFILHIAFHHESFHGSNQMIRPVSNQQAILQ